MFSNEILEMVSEMEIIKALWKERTLAREVLYQPRCSGLLETDVSEHSNHLPTPFTLFLFSLPRWKKYVDIKACIPVPYYEKDIFFWMLVLEGLVGLHRTIQLQLYQHYCLGHRLGLL